MSLGYFTDSTPLTPLRDPFNVLVDGVNAVETAVEDLESSRAIQTFRWADATARAAQTGMVAGDIGYQINTNTYFGYASSAWTPVYGVMPWFEAALTGTNNVTATEGTIGSYATPVSGGGFSFTFTSGVLTLPLGGLWLIEASGVLNGVSNAERWVRITKNGTSAAIASVRANAATSWGFDFSLAQRIRAVAGDTVRLRASQQTGGTISMTALSSESPALRATYLGPA